MTKNTNADREAAADWVDDFRDEVAGMLGITPKGMVDDVQDAIIDELDKRLMPPGMEWPRFEDGEKVRFGDRFDHTEGYSNILVDGFEFFDQGCAVYKQHGIREPYCYGERVKRHKPEVLAADGLPIKVGDTVYGAGREQGVYTVVSLRAGEGRFSVECEDRDGERCMVDASMVAHTKPDTQERIDEDALMDAGKYVAWHPEAARLREYPTSFSAKQAMMADLLRRQRELDARTMGGE